MSISSINPNFPEPPDSRIPATHAGYLGISTLASNWKMMIARGVFSIIFGLLALAWPVATLFSIAILFGAYALVDGIFALSIAFHRARAHASWGVAILEGILGIAAGIVTLFYPALTALILLYTIAFWAVVTGLLEIYGAIRMRSDVGTAILLGMMGLVSVALGALVMSRPIIGAVAVVAMISAYALIFGVAATALGLRLRKVVRSQIEQKDFPIAA